MLEFTDPEVSQRYVALVEKDRMVELPKVYRGMLSNITWSMARKMVRQGCTDVIAARPEIIEKPAGPVAGPLAGPALQASGNIEGSY